MIRTRVENLKEGDILAYPVIDGAGRVLIGADIPLKAIVIRRLKELGFNYVYVDAAGFEDIERLEMISQTTELEIIKTSREVFGKIKRSHELDPQKIQHLAVTVLNEILNKKNIAIVIDDLMVSSDYLFRHLARTMLFCSVLGINLGYGENKLRELAKAAFYTTLDMHLLMKILEIKRVGSQQKKEKLLGSILNLQTLSLQKINFLHQLERQFCSITRDLMQAAILWDSKARRYLNLQGLLRWLTFLRV